MAQPNLTDPARLMHAVTSYLGHGCALDDSDLCWAEQHSGGIAIDVSTLVAVQRAKCALNNRYISDGWHVSPWLTYGEYKQIWQDRIDSEAWTDCLSPRDEDYIHTTGSYRARIAISERRCAISIWAGDRHERPNDLSDPGAVLSPAHEVAYLDGGYQGNWELRLSSLDEIDRNRWDRFELIFSLMRTGEINILEPSRRTFLQEVEFVEALLAAYRKDTADREAYQREHYPQFFGESA